MSLDYSRHPAFEGLESIFYDSKVEQLYRELSKKFQSALLKLQFEATTVDELWGETLKPGLDRLFSEILRQSSQSQIQHLSHYIVATQNALELVMKADLLDSKCRYGANESLHNMSELQHFENLSWFRHTLTSFNSDQVAELKHDLKDQMDTILDAYRLRIYSREGLSTGKVPGLACKKLTTWFENCGLLPALSAYMGRPYRVFGFAVELSVPESNWWSSSYPEYPEVGRESLYYHLDQGRSAPKALVYLTDVDHDCGPTQYVSSPRPWFLSELDSAVARSMDCQVLSDEIMGQYRAESASGFLRNFSSSLGRRHFYALPECMRHNSHFGWDVYPGSEHFDRIVDGQQSLIGPAGTAMCFDGSHLLHRGGVHCKKPRWALQVVFGEIK